MKFKLLFKNSYLFVNYFFEKNHLNLPVKITFENNSQKFIQYLYTATGQKLQKMVRHLDSLSTTRYLHGFQYYDNVLQFFHTPDGYVKNTPDTTGNPSFDYIYQYKDHLGNVRVNYAQDPLTGETGILEESHYYPFGLQHSNYNSDITKIDRKEENNNEKSFDDTVTPFSPFENPGYNYKYNGMELQSEFGVEMYDFGARNYDPAIGRWMNVDPLAEKYFFFSPYTYAANNPIIYRDPDGRKIIIGSHISNALTQLAMIAITEKGQKRIDRLVSSNVTYTMFGTFRTSKSAYDCCAKRGVKNAIYFPTSVWWPLIGVGAAKREYLTGHEIQHAYNDDMNRRLNKKEEETSAVNFANYLRAVHGETSMRTVYMTLGLTFSKKPVHYNFYNEKITGFKEILNISEKGETVLGFSYVKDGGKEGAKNKIGFILVTSDKNGLFKYMNFDSDSAFWDFIDELIERLQAPEDEEADQQEDN